MQNVVHLCLAVPYGGKLQQGINNHLLIKKTNRIFFFLHYNRNVALIHLNLVENIRNKPQNLKLNSFL